MIYTNLDNLKLKVKTASYKRLGNKFYEWIYDTTIKLYTGRTESEKKAALILRKLNITFEPQCFFFDSISKKSYFLDFYLLDKNIALEVDGGYHELNKNYDKERDTFFSSIGIKTIRIKNSDITIANIQSKIFNPDIFKDKQREKQRLDELNLIKKLVSAYNKKYYNKINLNLKIYKTK
jgi:very-short-patch-repair endonuclease